MRAFPDASVVIPARNAAPWIAEQLESLAHQQKAPRFEVVLADNDSSDGGVQGAQDAARLLGLDLRVVAATGVMSASHGRNVGAEAASGEVLLFCDADDLVGPYWVADLVSAVLSTPGAVVAGALHHERFNSPGVLAAYGIAPDPVGTEGQDAPQTAEPQGDMPDTCRRSPGQLRHPARGLPQARGYGPFLPGWGRGDRLRMASAGGGAARDPCAPSRGALPAQVGPAGPVPAAAHPATWSDISVDALSRQGDERAEPEDFIP